MENLKGTKRNHYLSVCYQKQFTDSKGMLHAYVLPPGSQWIKHLYPVLPENIGFEKDRYTLINSDGTKDRRTIERIYQRYEDEISKYLHNKYRLLGMDALEKILVFMFHLIHRSSVFWCDAEKQEFYNKYSHLPESWKKNARLILAIKKYFKKYVLRMLEAFDFMLIQSTDDFPFITGDAPAMIGRPGKNISYFSGLNNVDTEVYFPISSQICLIGFRKGTNVEAIYRGLSKNVTNRKAAIKEINKCIVMKSHGLIISSTTLPEVLIKQMGYFDFPNRTLGCTYD